jgi:hypothetical protein
MLQARSWNEPQTGIKDMPEMGVKRKLRWNFGTTFATAKIERGVFNFSVRKKTFHF